MDDLIRFRCTSCGKGLKAKRALIGKIVKCPEYSSVVTIAEEDVVLTDSVEPFSGTGGTLPTSTLKPCPFCAEMIQAAAIKCRFCGEMLTGATGTLPQKLQPTLVKEIRACVRKGWFGRLWGTLSVYSDKIVFKGETEHSDDVSIPLENVTDVNDRRDGGQQLLIIRFKDRSDNTRNVEYDYPSTAGERLSTKDDRLTSWNDWVRILNDMAIQSRQGKR